MSRLLTFTSGTVVPQTKVPTAVVVQNPQFGVLGTVVKLDGRQSFDPNGLPITFDFEFASVPSGSKVQQEGFRQLEEAG